MVRHPDYVILLGGDLHRESLSVARWHSETCLVDNKTQVVVSLLFIDAKDLVLHFTFEVCMQFDECESSSVMFFGSLFKLDLTVLVLGVLVRQPHLRVVARVQNAFGALRVRLLHEAPAALLALLFVGVNWDL